MSLEKAIASGKEHRQPYRGSQSFDVSCRAHGGGHKWPCGYCERNRLWHHYREQVEAKEQIRDGLRNDFWDGC